MEKKRKKKKKNCCRDDPVLRLQFVFIISGSGRGFSALSRISLSAVAGLFTYQLCLPISERETDRQTDRDRQAGRQADRQTVRQTDIERDTET